MQMTEDKKKDQNKNDVSEDTIKKPSENDLKEDIKEISVEDKLKETEEKLLRSLAEIEIKEEDLKKEVKDAFEFALTLLKKFYRY